MTTHSSSTAVATSEISKRVAGALREATERRSDEEAARIERLRARIEDLESRGFIKRQEYSSPSTGDFERIILHRKG